MQKQISTIILLIISTQLFSQSIIRGKVIEKETQNPVEFAEVILLNNEDSSIVTGSVTNENGEFNIETKLGVYNLKVTYVDQILFSKKITVNDKSFDLDNIEVSISQNLEEVIISSKKKLVERKIDRLIFNVEDSPRSSAGDAIEILKVTPGVRVQNDQIKIIGKGNVRVMVNGKIIEVPDDDLSNFLSSIASENIKNIEVITTPPAKYEASGNSGFVNIVMKEAKNDSWNAQIKSGFRQRRYPSGNIGGNFNFNKNKFSLASSLNYRDGFYYQEQDDYAYFPDGLWYTLSPFKVRIDGLNARLDLDYNITKNWSMGGQYLYNNTNYDLTENPFTPVFDYDTNETIRSLNTEGRTTLSPKIHSVNYNNEVVLDTLGKKVSLNLDYFKYENPDQKTYEGIQIINNPFSEQFYNGININQQNVSNLSAKLDFEYPTSNINLNFGGKVTFSESTNDIFLFNSGLVDEMVTDLPLTQNDFKYDEDIQALYVSAQRKIGNKLDVKLGLRIEVTQSNSNSEILNIDVDNDYAQLFPSVYLNQEISENSNLLLNYNKRIERPAFYQLNPNIYFLNPFQTIEGNPFLQPAFIDNIELTYTYKDLSTKVYFTYEDNMFSQIPLADSETNFIRFAQENFIDTHRLGLIQDYTFDKLNWLTSNNSFDISYVHSSFNLEEDQENQKGINARVSTYNDVNLNPAKTLLLGVNFWYSFPGVNGIFDTKSASSFALSLQSLLLDKKLNITLRANDIFRDSAERTTTTVNGVFQEARYYYDSQFIQLSASYKFGNNNLKVKKHQTGNSTEKSRTGN